MSFRERRFTAEGLEGLGLTHEGLAAISDGRGPS